MATPRVVKKHYTRQDLTNKRKLQGVADLFGMDLDELMAKGRQAVPMIWDNTKAQLEAEAVLLFVAKRGKGFKVEACKWCKQDFAHTYTNVAYCSEHCRSESLKEIGIQWNPDGRSDIERWDNRMPMVIGPYGTERALEWLEKNPEQLELPAELHPYIPKLDDTAAKDAEVDEILRKMGIG